jgi:hypothetical protein
VNRPTQRWLLSDARRGVSYCREWESGRNEWCFRSATTTTTTTTTTTVLLIGVVVDSGGDARGETVLYCAVPRRETVR